VPEPCAGQELFEIGHRRTERSVDQLWMRYLAPGGTLVVFDLGAHLSGPVPLPAGQQDVVACGLNERIRDLYTAARCATSRCSRMSRRRVTR
jgi:hypothetical protein